MSKFKNMKIAITREQPIDEISHKAYRELYKILKGDQL